MTQKEARTHIQIGTQWQRKNPLPERVCGEGVNRVFEITSINGDTLSYGYPAGTPGLCAGAADIKEMIKRIASGEYTIIRSGPGKKPRSRSKDKSPCALFACKVAFSLPETEDPLSDQIYEELMGISPGNTIIETVGGPCSPPLLLVDVKKLPTAEWVETIAARMNKILGKKPKKQHA
jgi:hypothetical protein